MNIVVSIAFPRNEDRKILLELTTANNDGELTGDGMLMSFASIYDAAEMMKSACQLLLSHFRLW